MPDSFTYSESPSLNKFDEVLKSPYIYKEDVLKYFKYCKMFNNCSDMKVTYTKKSYNGVKIGRYYPELTKECPITASLMWSPIRSTLFSDNETDIDIVNCHPTILLNICKENNIRQCLLEKYVKDRLTFISDLKITEKDVKNYNEKNHTVCSKIDLGKLFFTAIIYGSSIKNMEDIIGTKDIVSETSVSKHLIDEIKIISKEVTKISKYQYIIDAIKSDRRIKKLPYHTGSGMSFILQEEEVNIVINATHIFEKHNISIGSYIYDGFQIKCKDLNKIEDVLKEINNNTYVKFIIKPFKTKLSALTYEIPIRTEKEIELHYSDGEQDYLRKKEEFEKHTFLIMDMSKYIDICNGKIIFKSKEEIKSTYEHLKYTSNEGEECFIKKWFVDKNKKTFDSIDIFPKEDMCPPNIFNMWKPFAMELVTDYKPNKDGRDLLLKHFEILCNHEMNIYDTFVKWIAFIIQFPERKSYCIDFKSEEGAGKGTLFDILSALLGSEKLFKTPKPQVDIFGTFQHPALNNSIINFLDEMSSKKLEDLDDDLKSAITEPTFNMNIKNMKQFTINNYFRFISATNKTNAIKIKKDDRRHLMIECSNEKIGNIEYFTEIRKQINDINTIKTLYEYLKDIDLTDFDSVKPPMTKYKESMVECNKDYLEVFLDDYLLTFTEDKWVPVNDIYDAYCEFCKSNNSPFTSSKHKFGMDLGLLKNNRIGESEKRYKKETKGNERMRFIKGNCLIECPKE